jgi:DGQHR domain-containing protein
MSAVAEKKLVRRHPEDTSGSPNKLRLLVIEGQVLGVRVYRGFGRLCDLANMSEADVFDQKENPLGTQRDLSPKHAKDAYSYVKNRDFAFWPEVFLCARNRNVISFREQAGSKGIGILTIDMETITQSDAIAISRVDGNHRLHFAGGTHSGFPSIAKEVSFCIAYDLTLQEEITLFRDINDNQRRMNTSHLDNIAARLTPEEIRKREDPPLYIAKKLGEDQQSPFFDKVYEGGRKPGYFMIPLRSLKSGIRYMLSQPTKLSALPDPDAQYRVIRNYFSAVKQWEPKSWNEPTKYLLLRGAGLWAICFIGATVVDRTLGSGKFGVSDMLAVLQSGDRWDWSKNGDFAGYSGRGGATRIRDRVVGEFPDESGISIKNLAKKILTD